LVSTKIFRIDCTGAAGAIIGEGPIALIVNHIGYRSTILSLSVIGFVLTLLIWLIVRDAPSFVPHQHAQHGSEWQRLRRVIAHSQNAWVALYSFAIWAPVLILAGLWVVPFLMVLYQTSNTVAASAASWVWVGIGLGSPFFGWWSDKIGRRCMPLAISALLSVVPAIFIIYVPHLSWVTMCFLLFVFGIGGSGQALSFGLVQDNNPPHVAGTAVGFNNMAVVFGGVILQPLVGFLLHSQWTGKYLNDVPVYSASDYRHALITVPLCGLLALIVSLFFLKETHCQPQYSLDNFVKKKVPPTETLVNVTEK
jgi:MFS family permease